MSVLEPRAWAEVCQVIEDPTPSWPSFEAVRAHHCGRRGDRSRAGNHQDLDGQKQRAMRLFTIAEVDDST